MNVVDTDYLTLMRADLVAVLDSLDIPHHDTEPRSLGEAPAAWFGRPTISYDPFDHMVLVDWSLTFAGHPVDGENTTHEFDQQVWALIREFRLGMRAMVDGQRSVQFLRADPSQQTIGELVYPIYDLAIRTTVHTGIC